MSKIEDLARLTLYGKFPGKSGTVDRRVLWCLVWRWQGSASEWINYKVGHLATASGTHPNRVRESLVRLAERGLITSRNATDHTRKSPTVYTDNDGNLVHYVKSWRINALPEGVDSLPELPEGIFSSNPPETVKRIRPTHELWLATGYSGKHSHVYALQQAGVTSAVEIAKSIGVTRPNIYPVLKSLAALEGMPEEELGSLLFDGYQRREGVQAEVAKRWAHLEKLRKAPKGRAKPEKEPAPALEQERGFRNGHGNTLVLRVAKDKVADLMDEIGAPTTVLEDAEGQGVLIGYQVPEGTVIRSGTAFGAGTVPSIYYPGTKINNLPQAEAPRQLLRRVATVPDQDGDEPTF